MRKELADILSRNRPQLVESIDPENGILNDLIAMSVFTRRQAKSIEVLSDPFKQVEALLDMLRRRPDEDFDKFCEVLCKHGQEEVVSRYLKPDISTSKPQEDFQVLEEKQNPIFKSDVLSVRPTVVSSSEIKVQKSTVEFYNKHKDMAYPMCNSYRGRCLIFNVEIVEGMARRQGSEGDLRNLRELFSELHFSTNTFTNPTAKDIIDKIVEISSDPSLGLDQCLILFFLSHGRIVTTQGSIPVEVIYGSDGRPVTTESLLKPLTNASCPALSGKPKLVFFQACRECFTTVSEETSLAITAKDLPDASRGTPEAQISEVQTPASSASSLSFPCLPSDKSPISLKDFVIGYSTESGFASFRDTHAGSWYISAIVKVFAESVHNMDLCAMLRKVNGIITEWKPVGTGIDTRHSQVTSHIDSLTKPYLFFFPGITTGS